MAWTQDLFDPTPSPEQVRAQLARVLQSPEFARTTRMKGLLEFIVLRVLEGREDQLTSTVIAAQVTLTASGAMPTGSDNPDTAAVGDATIVVVGGGSELVVTKYAERADGSRFVAGESASVGERVRYALELTNAGDAPLAGAVVEDPVVKVTAQQSEFPELVRDVLADIGDRAVRADDDLFALGLRRLRVGGVRAHVTRSVR